MKKHQLQQETLEQLLLRKLRPKTNKDGDFIYDGPSDEKDRTGTNLELLVQYAMGKQRTKPIDYSEWVQYVSQTLKIPEQQLYCAKTVWKKLK